MKSKNLKSLKWLILLSILEGLFTIFATVSIKADPKNVIFLGFSYSRWAILLICFLILTGLILLFIKPNIANRFICYLFTSGKRTGWIKGTGLFLIISLWLTVWFPAYRFENWEAGFIRIRPFFVWLQLIGVQFALYFLVISGKTNLKDVKSIILRNKKNLFIALGMVVLGIVLLVILRDLFPQVLGTGGPGTPLAPLQIFSMWIILLGIYFIFRDRSGSLSSKNIWTITLIILLWATAFILWKSAPFFCQDDRPGPFPPNYQCYPKINDAVYSIGSHYITLGQGIYNHWPTDKPLYMVFLAIGQWVFGPNIDDYLNFQIAVMAIIPGLLFLLGRKFTGFSGGVFLAGISILNGYNDIVLYTQVGGGSVKLENTEILTSFLLILLCFGVFEWLRKPFQLIWAVVSGGLLGLSMLVRMNPIFIIPVILLAYCISNRKDLKSLFMGILVFLVTFALVFSPWVLSARDSEGNNFYLSKINNVISERYSAPTQIITSDPTQLPIMRSTPQSSTSGNPTENQASADSSVQSVSVSGMGGIAYHFLANEISSLGILPLNFTLIPNVDQVKQSIWNLKFDVPVWMDDLSLENILAMLFAFTMIILGLLTAVKKFGLAGLSALFIQTGYFIGDAVAKTSGGRYLEPVNWVTFLYFSIGVYAATLLFLDILKPNKAQVYSFRQIQNQSTAHPGRMTSKLTFLGTLGGIGGFLVLGLVIPIMNNLPNSLPAEANPEAVQIANTQLLGQGAISNSQWQEYLKDPEHLIVQGISYNARYYRGGDLWPGNLSFEMMVLGKSHVFASYLFNVEPKGKFSDGSNVILVGCQMGQDDFWGAKRIIMESYAVIQIDHEKQVYVDPDAKWKCPKP